MHRRFWVAAAVVLSWSWTSASPAQAPPGGQTPSPGPGVQSRDNTAPPAAAARGNSGYRRRSIVHHYPYPYPEHYHGDQTAGFRNPGGVGRYREYYPPGDKFQENNDPVRPARFDQGGGAPDRAEQTAAQQVGVQRGNEIMNHIDRYSRPYYGYGVGLYGGFY